MHSKQWYTVAYALRHGWLWILTALLILVSISLSFAYVQNETTPGGKDHWPDSYAILNLRLGCPPPPGLSLWGPCWDDAAQHAAQQWNAAGARFQFRFQSPSQPATVSCTTDQIDFLNTVLWTPNICGRAWGEAVAITGTWTLATGEIGDTDVLFNRNLIWNVYTGPLRRAHDFHRVAIHEFGHALGLAHPDDHGQRVTALMNSRTSNIDRLQPDDVAGIRAIYGTAPSTVTTKGALGNPGHQTFKSGIGVISGWVCSAQRVEVQIGTQRIRMAYGTERLDTQGVCGDANNGFVTLVNFNRLQDGVHTARLIVDGRQIGQAHEFKVTTFGQEFARGWEGIYTLPNFPHSGRDVLIGWDQGTQNFAILEKR